MRSTFSKSLAVAIAFGLLTAAPAAAALGLHEHQVAGGGPAAVPPAPPGSALVAPQAACPDQERLDAPAAAQEATMECMVDFARAQAGLGALTRTEVLHQSALEKSADILRCDSFSHFACGREFSYWIKAAGYTSTPCWRIGENLAWGDGEYGSVRSTFLAWMRSPTHRENILGDYEESGVGLRVGTLGGEAGTRVWAQHFGSHCG
ncbi:MAG TPA: CAP domain-containing protein [Solirubrobacterales bacterium]|nr:CAP domain-containing protein [Solirubrobacterales bacterium]